MFDNKKYYIENKEKIKKQSRQWQLNNREKVKEYHKKWKKDNPEKVKEQKRKQWKKYYKNNRDRLMKMDRLRKRKNKYNLSHEDWLKMWESQNGKCAICGKPFEVFSYTNEESNSYIDHNHKTGEIRGLLCHKCNTAIGFLNDVPKLLSKAIEYLTKI